MYNKTAMTLLFEEFKSLSETARFSGDIGTANLIDFLCERENVAIKKERQQIEEAYMDSTLQFDNSSPIINPKTPSEYYNQTYTQKQ